MNDPVVIIAEVDQGGIITTVVQPAVISATDTVAVVTSDLQPATVVETVTDSVEVIVGDGSGGGGGGVIGIDQPSSYRHVQTTPQMMWTIMHYLGFSPAGVITFNQFGETMEGTVLPPTNPNVTLVQFTSPVAGEALVS